MARRRRRSSSGDGFPTIPNLGSGSDIFDLYVDIKRQQLTEDISEKNRAMKFFLAQQQAADARSENTMKSLEKQWANSKSDGDRAQLQSTAKSFISRHGNRPDMVTRLSNFSIVDRNLEDAQKYSKFNRPAPVNPELTWAEDFAAKSKAEFDQRHFEERTQWIAGGKQGPLNLTKIIEYGEDKEGVKQFATFNDDGAIPLYGSTNKNDMRMQSEAEKLGMKAGEFLQNVSGDGTISKKVGTMQVDGRKMNKIRHTKVVGKDRGKSFIEVQGLPADLRADSKLMAGVMKLHGDETKTKDLEKKDLPAKTYLNELQNLYKFQGSKKPEDIVKALRAKEYMSQVLPHKTAVLLDPGEKEGFVRNITLFGDEDNWTESDTERIQWVDGTRTNIADKTGKGFGFIHDKTTDGIKDKNGNPVKIEATDKNGNLVSHVFKTGTEVQTWLSTVDYQAMKNGNAKIIMPTGVLFSAGKGQSGIQDGRVEAIASVGNYQIGQSGPDDFYIKQAGEGWRLPATNDEAHLIRVYRGEKLRTFRPSVRGTGLLERIQ